MATKEFLMNKNQVAYCTAVSNRFEPNKNGVLLQTRDMNSFCFQVSISGIKPEYPKTKIIKAIPNKDLKEKWIEKTFYVNIPVKAQKDDIDMFLQRVGDFTVDFKDAVGYSAKGIAKMKRGNSIKYKDKEGEFIVSFGDKVGGKIEFQSDSGTINRVLLDASIEVKKGAKDIKAVRRDSQGRPFDFYASPDDDIENVINDMIKTEINTICRSDRFKVNIIGVKRGSLKVQDKESGKFKVVLDAKILSV